MNTIHSISKYTNFGRDILSLIYRLMGRNSIHINSNNSVSLRKQLLKRCRVRIIGSGNTIIFRGNNHLINCSIYICGNNNVIEIGSDNILRHGEFWIEDDHNKIELGNHNSMFGPVHLAAIEQTTISIGSECLFSDQITLRTGDSHSIIDKATLKRTNRSVSIRVEDHVWVGQGSTLLKGTRIAKDTVIATKSLVLGQFDEPGIIVGGAPARILKKGITWDINRIQIAQ